MKKFNKESIMILKGDQKKAFFEAIPSKVYRTERNIGIIVACTQLLMIALFLARFESSFHSSRGVLYFSLYVFLLFFTLLAIYLYRITIQSKKLTSFLMLRRAYAFILCIWVLGITYLETNGGKGITVYCYLMPTVGAVLLLTPIEGLVIFGGMGMTLIVLFILGGNNPNMFGNIVNSIFVTVLTMYISYRYYRSTAVEFCDHETISSQYKEIESSNILLKKLAHVDQLTNLCNRHYLTEMLYPQFEVCQKNHYSGTFLMMDIDYFKQYNDTYGHIQGDVCLQTLAYVLSTICNTYNAEVIRFGGEEFLIVKMGDDSFDPDAFALEVKEAIHGAKLDRNDVEFKEVTVSMGIWSGPLHNVAHIETAIKYADEALYEAKKLGRNRIVNAI